MNERESERVKDSSLTSPERSTPAAWSLPAPGLSGDTRGPELLSWAHRPQKGTEGLDHRGKATGGNGWLASALATALRISRHKKALVVELTCTQASGAAAVSVCPALSVFPRGDPVPGNGVSELWLLPLCGTHTHPLKQAVECWPRGTGAEQPRRMGE